MIWLSKNNDDDNNRIFVIDVNHSEDGPKLWDVGKKWSETIDYLLKQGHSMLRVARVGSAMKTKYYFSPIVGREQ